MPGILSYSIYVPQYRLPAEEVSKVWRGTATGIRSRSVTGPDEDVISMATEAALAALSKGGIDGSALGGIFFATTSSPYGLKSAAAVVADLLGAPKDCWVLDLGAGTQAGLSTLAMALSTGALDKPILVLGADALAGEPGDPAEFSFGAAAAAFVVSSDGAVARLDALAPRCSSYTHVWRTNGQRYLSRHDDSRFERHAGYAAQMEAALRQVLELAGGKVDKLALHLADAQQHNGLLRALKLDPAKLAGVEFVRSCGDTGCANALVNLALALAQSKAGERIITQAYGSGAGTISAVLTAGEAAASNGAVPVRQTVDVSYNTYAKYVGILPVKGLPEMGSSYAASPGWERAKRMELGLRGQLCRSCGSLNFPKRHYCLDCRGQEFDEVALPRTATILTFNMQYVVSVAPEEAPIPIANAQLDGAKAGGYGGKVAAMMTDFDPDAVKIGMRVELVPRRCGVELGLVRYGYKYRPLVEEN